MQSAIFDEFRRGDDAPGQGLGLGLSIAERIAQLLDAPLILRSKPDGSSRPDHSMLEQHSRVGGAPSHGPVFALRVVRVGVPAPAIGRALCRERVIQYVLTSEVAVSCTKNCQQI